MGRAKGIILMGRRVANQPYFMETARDAGNPGTASIDAHLREKGSKGNAIIADTKGTQLINAHLRARAKGAKWAIYKQLKRGMELTSGEDNWKMKIEMGNPRQVARNPKENRNQNHGNSIIIIWSHGTNTITT